MGGLVARTMQLQRRDDWNRMMKVNGARILMLGTPNDGSWAPMQVLSGDDTFGNMLTVVGAPFRGHETRQLIAQFPGLLQLQAGLLDDLGKQERWKALAEEDLAAFRANSVWHRLPLQLDQFKWGIPSQQVLDRAVSLRRNLDKQRDTDLGAFAENLLLVVGKAGIHAVRLRARHRGTRLPRRTGPGRRARDAAERAASRRGDLDARLRARRASTAERGV